MTTLVSFKTKTPQGPNASIPVAPTANTLVTAYATFVTDLATLVTAMGVLVADGASPTQAHVTTANNALTAVSADWVTLKAAIDSNQTAGAGAITVTIDKDVFTSMDFVNRAFRLIERQCFSSGVFPNP